MKIDACLEGLQTSEVFLCQRESLVRPMDF
jgi:hypothetical protein